MVETKGAFSLTEVENIILNNRNRRFNYQRRVIRQILDPPVYSSKNQKVANGLPALFRIAAWQSQGKVFGYEKEH